MNLGKIGWMKTGGSTELDMEVLYNLKQIYFHFEVLLIQIFSVIAHLNPAFSKKMCLDSENPDKSAYYTHANKDRSILEASLEYKPQKCEVKNYFLKGGHFRF